MNLKQKLKIEALLMELLRDFDENPFFNSCLDFYELRGYLTEKQITALEDMRDREQYDGICYDEITYGD